MSTSYGWLVQFQDGDRIKITHQPGYDVLNAISSALRWNPDKNVSQIIDVRREGPLPE